MSGIGGKRTLAVAALAPRSTHANKQENEANHQYSCVVRGGEAAGHERLTIKQSYNRQLLVTMKIITAAFT
jgi:hypothetical protein